MARESTKKLKNTWGYCEVCERFYKHPDYVVQYNKVMCRNHMDEYVKELSKLKDRKY